LKAKAKAKGKESSTVSTWSVHVSRSLTEGSMLVLLAVAIYILVSLSTYNSADPGWSYIGPETEVANSMGRVGAWCADVLLLLFGYLAFILPPMIAYRAWLVFKHQRHQEEWLWPMFWVRGVGLVMTLVAGTALAALYFQSDGQQLPASAGGVLGWEVGSWTLSIFGAVGATLLLLTFFLVGITVFTSLSWIDVIDLTGKLALQGVEKSKQGFIYLNTRWQSRKETKAIENVKAEREEPFVAKKLVIAERKAPVIKTVPKVPEASGRVQIEKQQSLFDADASGTLPALALLDQLKPGAQTGFSAEVLESMSRLLEIKLKDFGVVAEVMAVQPGPVVTRFEIQPAAGVKASRITNLAKDLARSLAVISVRVVEVIPGKTFVGIEIPNEQREMIMLNEVISSVVFDEAKSPLTLALGKDISGQPIVADLAKMPHLLVAGTTGSGKSVGLNAMLLSLLFKATADEVRLIMIDPKMLELSVYDGIPHLLTPVVTDMKEAANALRWCVAEMERRYKLMAAMGVRNLAGFNRKVLDAEKAGTPIKDPVWKPTDGDELGQEPPFLESLPYIVVVIDEFADMMMIVGKKVEELIARIAQKARAAGIHLILATQRPSVDVITGLIKANVPSRIGFQVSSRIDSRTILDQGGAEQLLGHGDMLYLPPGTSMPVRVHGAFVSDEEVHRVCDDWRKRGGSHYLEDILEGTHDTSSMGGASGDSDSEQDEYYDLAVEFITETRRASISSVQRKFKIGYNRSARIIEAMEAAGVVTEMQNNGSREVLAPSPIKS